MAPISKIEVSSAEFIRSGLLRFSDGDVAQDVDATETIPTEIDYDSLLSSFNTPH